MLASGSKAFLLGRPLHRGLGTSVFSLTARFIYSGALTTKTDLMTSTLIVLDKIDGQKYKPLAPKFLLGPGQEVLRIWMAFIFSGVINAR
jgi:hypothetical protein